MRTIGTVFLLVSLDLFVRQTGILISLEVVDYLIDRLREGVLHAAGDGGVRTAELRSSPRGYLCRVVWRVRPGQVARSRTVGQRRHTTTATHLSLIHI